MSETLASAAALHSTCQQTRTLRWSGALLGSRSVDSTSVVAAAEQASGPNHAACHLSRTVQPERAVSVTAIVAKKTGLHRVEKLGLA
jgi:PP-loop superfamily ATP-utilizing enzyme